MNAAETEGRKGTPRPAATRTAAAADGGGSGYEFSRDGERNPASPGRDTATFEPYYWEAYNEIVQPRRFDHYLVRRWLPELGPLGFAIVKALRDRCYHDPRSGVLRDSCEVDVEELAGTLRTSRASLFREFGRNEALGSFVRRVKQYQMVDGKPRQDRNLYQISMDDPVHPADLDRYEELRAVRERDRDVPRPTKVVKGLTPRPGAYESQSDTHRGVGYESQSATHTSAKVAYESQIDTADTKCLGSQIATPDTSCPGSQSDTAVVYLPSGGGLPTESDTPGSRADSPPIKSPQGEDRHGSAVEAEGDDPSPDEVLWAIALSLLADRVNKPTYEAHLRTLRPLGRSADRGGAFSLGCPSLFTREWLDKRHRGTLEAALSEAAGEEVTVCLTV
jgi:hypothetical protein